MHSKAPGSVNTSKCSLGDKVILTGKVVLYSCENKPMKVAFVEELPTLGLLCSAKPSISLEEK